MSNLSIVKTISKEKLIAMIFNGANNLYNNYEYINALNVFPVPDGDTGTNMNLTMRSGIEALKGTGNDTFAKISKTVTHGLLMGARGNSGVILSQFFRGFCEGIKHVKTEIKVVDVIQAFKNAKERAYASVVNAVEGTILTVTRVIDEKLQDEIDPNKDMSMNELFKFILDVANDTTTKTQEMLKVLKDAGVVDSGAKGLTLVLEGFFAAIENREIEKKESQETHDIVKQDFQSSEEEFGFCTEFLIRLKNDVEETDVRKKLADMEGVSIVVVKNEDLLKVHVHVEDPLEAFKYAVSLGEIVKIKAENMTMQAEGINADEHLERQESLELAIVTTARGAGLISTLYERGAHNVIDTSQGAPSVDAFVRACESTNAKNVIVLPNDKNYIFAAEGAKKATSKVKIRLVKSKSSPEGLAALDVLDLEESYRDNAKLMRKAIKDTQSIQVTTAAKDTVSNDIKIKKGDSIVIVDGKITGKAETEIGVLKNFIEGQKKRSSVEHINIIFGRDVKEKTRTELKELLEKYRLAEKTFIEGNHPLYSVIIGLE